MDVKKRIDCISVPAVVHQSHLESHRDCTCLVRRTSVQVVHILGLGPVVHRRSCGQDTFPERLARTAGLAEACHHAASGRSQEVPLLVAAGLAVAETESAE